MRRLFQGPELDHETRSRERKDNCCALLLPFQAYFIQAPVEANPSDGQRRGLMCILTSRDS